MILLDADVIIDLHRLNVWNQVVKKNIIYISSIILRQEVHFFEDYNGVCHSIALLGKKEQGISFEKLLKSSGLTKNLEFKHTEKCFRKYLDEGSIMRIQSCGIKK